MDTNILLGLLNLSYNTFIIPDFRIKVKHNLYNNGMNGTLFGLLKTTLFKNPAKIVQSSGMVHSCVDNMVRIRAQLSDS
jgi:hypothetical protein